MIIYDLTCDQLHEFEGWFKNSDDLTVQLQNGLLTCPFCNSANITKKLAAPKISQSKSNQLPEKKSTQTSTSSVALSSKQSAQQEQQKLQSLLKQVNDYVDKNYKDVGNRFAEKAIKMHKGEIEQENIRGSASKEQIKELNEEGVSVLPLPPKPIDKKKIN